MRVALPVVVAGAAAAVGLALGGYMGITARLLAVSERIVVAILQLVL